MTVCFRAFNGRVAVWTKPLTGDPMAPFDNPLAHMDKIKFHSDLQYLSSSIVQDVSISHTSLAGVAGTGYALGNAGGSAGTSQPITDGQLRVTSIPLLTHDLGYVPLVYVIYGNQLVSPGLTVQSLSDRWRGISVYATTTQVFVREVAISSREALPAVSRSYRVIVFREPTEIAGEPTFQVKPSANLFGLGRGKVTQNHRPIRRVASGADYSFYIPVDRIADIRNGALRIINPDGEVVTLGQYNGAFNQTETIKVSY